jgi:hypothetical protein
MSERKTRLLTTIDTLLVEVDEGLTEGFGDLLKRLLKIRCRCTCGECGLS